MLKNSVNEFGWCRGILNCIALARKWMMMMEFLRIQFCSSSFDILVFLLRVR